MCLHICLRLRAASVLTYFLPLQGTGLQSEDSGPIGFDAELQCDSDGTACQSDHSWWAEGVGRVSLSMGRDHRITKICPTPMVALLNSNNTFWTEPEFERTGEIKPLPYCNTDLLHRHEVIQPFTLF